MELIKNIEEDTTDTVVRTIRNICETKSILIRVGYFSMYNGYFVRK